MKYLNILFITLICLILSACQGDSLQSESFSESGEAGVGGSYARFIIVGSFMYIVDDTSIKTFDVSDAAQPNQIDQKTIGERIESIFHFDSRLFVGSGAGLFIYQIEADGKPTKLSGTEYFDTFDTFACDPVVANETYAYVTLNTKAREESPCNGNILVETNVLKIFDVTDLTSPVLLSEYQMNAPKGVGLDGNILFLCDDDEGLKIFNVSDPLNIQLIKQFSTFTAFDVIPLNGLLLVVGPDNVYQFDYSNIEDIKMVATIPIGV